MSTIIGINSATAQTSTTNGIDTCPPGYTWNGSQCVPNPTPAWVIPVGIGVAAAVVVGLGAVILGGMGHGTL